MVWDKLLTPEEVGQILNVAPTTIRAWLKKGTLRGVKVGGLWRVKEKDLRAFLGEPQDQGSGPGGDAI